MPCPDTDSLCLRWVGPTGPGEVLPQNISARQPCSAHRFGIPGGTAHGHLGGTAHETGVSLGTGRQRQAQLVVRWSNGNSANPTVIPSHQEF